jgi:nucleoid DNA-binding protein
VRGVPGDWYPYREIEVVSTRTKTGQGKAEVEAVVESVLETIAEKLRGNEKVDLRGFGSFVVKG